MRGKRDAVYLVIKGKEKGYVVENLKTSRKGNVFEANPTRPTNKTPPNKL